MKYVDTPIKAIRNKCLECSYNQPKEVRLCPIVECACYPYRMGTRPSKATLDTMNKFYSENHKPTKGFSTRKGIGDK